MLFKFMISRLRIKIQKILLLDCPPRSIALAAAVGMLVGFSPYIGFHTVLAIGISFIFNLPLYPLILGAYVTNPLTFVPLYTICFKFGEYITGSKAEFPKSFREMDMTSLLTTAKTFLYPFFVGSHLLGLILGVITYILTYYLVKKYKDRV